MTDTPEEITAQRQLDDAVDNYLKANGFYGGEKENDFGVMTAYAVVAHVGGGFDKQGFEQSKYSVMYLNGSTPDHVAEGLFRMGIAFLENARSHTWKER